MGGNERTGRWQIAERCHVVNFMGGAELDLCDAELSDEAIEINVYTLMGGGQVRRGRKRRRPDLKRWSVPPGGIEPPLPA